MTIINWVIIIVISLLAGFADSKGFYFASQIWPNGRLDGLMLLKSAITFAIGLCFYWGSIFFLNKVGIQSAELQTGIWFLVVIIGVALASGEFSKWHSIDKIIAVITVVGFLFLLVRNNG